ncbi:HAD-IIIA family hydrolase [Candidatus Micrarchaeota archaeon]|nr:HAD-IIIA family hydrolase [Candidatus Micrarchaeota archaeon]
MKNESGSRLALLDRDGTINKEVNLLHDIRQLQLLEGAAEGIRLLNQNGFKVAIVTNQPVVARGLCSEDDVKKVNVLLLELLEKEGAKVDAVYYCPHHPEQGHSGANDPKYRKICDCRKPKPGMLITASKDFGIAKENCFMVGDHDRDIEGGKNFGCTTIFVKTGQIDSESKLNTKPDHVSKNLLEAAKLMVSLPMSDMKNVKAVIVAGGLGTRLGHHTRNVPKPMILVRGKPVLEHIIIHLKKYGITEIILCVGYLGEKIQAYFGDGAKFGVKIFYCFEKELLGTGGAIKQAEKFLDPNETFAMVYGDLLLEMDLEKLIKYHKEKCGLGTLTVHKSSHPYDSDILELAPDGRIIKFLGKPKKGDVFENISNAGVYCFEPSILKYFPDGVSMLDKEVLPSVIVRGGKLFAYKTNEHIHDMGTMDRLEKVRK